MNYILEMEGTLLSKFLLGVKWANPLLIWTFEFPFDLDLKAGKYMTLIPILRQEDIPLI